MESKILIYQTDDGNTKIEVRLEYEDIWLTQAQMGILYQKAKSSISEHKKEIFKAGVSVPVRCNTPSQTSNRDGCIHSSDEVYESTWNEGIHKI